MAARILIADGNELVAGSLAEQLASLGYEVVGIARSGAAALEACHESQPDLVLLDMSLPEAGGADATEQITSRYQIPVVIMLSLAEGADVASADSAGALGYLVKPVNPEELPPAIDIALARHQEFRQLRERVDNLHETIESRKLIERAKGILMRRFNITAAEAEERIQQRARTTNTRPQDIAQTIVDSDALLS